MKEIVERPKTNEKGDTVGNSFNHEVRHDVWKIYSYSSQKWIISRNRYSEVKKNAVRHFKFMKKTNWRYEYRMLIMPNFRFCAEIRQVFEWLSCTEEWLRCVFKQCHWSTLSTINQSKHTVQPWIYNVRFGDSHLSQRGVEHDDTDTVCPLWQTKFVLLLMPHYRLYLL